MPYSGIIHTDIFISVIGILIGKTESRNKIAVDPDAVILDRSELQGTLVSFPLLNNSSSYVAVPLGINDHLQKGIPVMSSHSSKLSRKDFLSKGIQPKRSRQVFILPVLFIRDGEGDAKVILDGQPGVAGLGKQGGKLDISAFSSRDTGKVGLINDAGTGLAHSALGGDREVEAGGHIPGGKPGCV